MANAREIKKRINSVRDTQKITNAMYLISSTKLQREREEFENTKPYFDALRTEIKRIFRYAGKVESRYFYPVDETKFKEGQSATLVITADKGLAGAYNQNAIKETERLMEEYPDMKLFVVGECGRQYFMQRGVPIEKSFLYTAQNPSMQRGREIASELLGFYDEGRISRIFIVYTDMKNGMSQDAKSECLLPFHRNVFEDTENEIPVSEPFEFVPSVKVVLDTIMPSYVAGFIYSALVDSFCSEQNARMNAMKAANDNAAELLEDLSLQYNRVRQAAITQEITEITSGAKAQKKKRMKEESES